MGRSRAIADPMFRGVVAADRIGAGRRAVAEVAGRNLKKVDELGGSDPFIVLSTDDLDATVGGGVAGRLGNCGQACNAAKRIIVAADLYDEFLDKFSVKMLAAAANCLRCPRPPQQATTRVSRSTMPSPPATLVSRR